MRRYSKTGPLNLALDYARWSIGWAPSDKIAKVDGRRTAVSTPGEREARQMPLFIPPECRKNAEREPPDYCPAARCGTATEIEGQHG